MTNRKIAKIINNSDVDLKDLLTLDAIKLTALDVKCAFANSFIADRDSNALKPGDTVNGQPTLKYRAVWEAHIFEDFQNIMFQVPIMPIGEDSEILKIKMPKNLSSVGIKTGGQENEKRKTAQEHDPPALETNQEA